ncbi:MAG: sigma-70 region 4 domain-containing protein [Clostridiales bacterium]|jgi:hypothetical protein|nr:sigma-70 region 4 domain-containing protein [Clostridiales bacterium]
MEEKNLWVKVIVSAYRGIPTIVEALETFIDKAALKSYRSDCMTLFENLSDKCDRKEKLVNLKCITDDAIAALSVDLRYIITSRISGVSFEDIAAGLGISLRAVFRHYSAALNGLAFNLRLKGFDEVWFFEYFKEEKYIEGIKSHFCRR